MKRKQAKENKPTSNKNISSLTKLPSISNKKSISSASHNLNLSIASYQDEGLITLIQEYLLKNNLFDTLDVFQKDCLKGFKQSIKSIDALKKELLEAFDTGHRDIFQIKFTQFVPLSMRTKDTKTLKMQFYIELYFYIYTIHPFLGKKKTIDTSSKQNFVSYLEGRGAILSKQEEFLPFYALAYLQKPQQHQTFKSMFTKQWIQDLRKQLILYIEKLYPLTKTPTIVGIYDKFIQFNLEAEKFSSVALTEPDEEYDQNPIEQKIEENLEDSLIISPQPILLENNNNSNKFANNSHKIINNSFQKFQNIEKNNQQTNLNGSFNSNINKSPLLTDKEHEELLELRQRVTQFQEEKAGYLSYIQTLTRRCQSFQNDRKEFSQSVKIILQESQNKWFRLIQQVYNLALDVFNAAITLNDGEPLKDPQLLAKRGEQLQRYKGFVSMNIEDLLSDNVADYSLFERPEHDLSVDMIKRNTEYLQKDQKLIEIDFEKIKSILKTTPESTMSESDVKQLQYEKCMILQALRWRMSKIRGELQKRQVVMSYIKYDLLEMKQKKGEKNVINVLIDSQNQSVVHQTTLFISVLGMDYYGRQYLHDNELIIKLISLRNKPNIEEVLKVCILVIFQVLSLNRACQAVMIDNGVMEEVLQALDKEKDQMPYFKLQYTVALLLNFLLSRKGLNRVEANKSHVIMTLTNMMQTEYPQVRSMVYASLYPMFARKSFREKALQFGMEANIKYLLENLDTEAGPAVQRQLEYIYSRLMMEGDEDTKDDDPYDDIHDDQIGEEEPIIQQQIQGPISGELLLMKKYSLTGPDAMRQQAETREQAKDTFNRPAYLERQQMERYSVQTPLLGKGRKSQIVIDKGGFSNNNSVYSNKNSNRILRSQKNSRIKNNIKPEKDTQDPHQKKEKEKVQKEYRQLSKEEKRNNQKHVEKIQENHSFENSKEKIDLSKKQKVLQIQNEEGTFRKVEKEESPLKGSLLQQWESQSIPINQNAKIINESSVENNQSMTTKLNRQNAEEANLRNKKLKPYQQGQDFVQAFQTRALLVRTPPQKPN